MYHIGDCVRYGQAGICRITEICFMECAGETKEYFVLSPLYREGNVVYVPCGNEELTGRMLPPLTEEEIISVLSRAKETEAVWIRDFRKRSEEAKRTLSSGDRFAVLMLIKNIHDHKKQSLYEGKRIHTTDDYFLKDAEQLLSHEIAFVRGISPAEALASIRAALALE